MALRPQDIDDFVELTLNKMIRKTWTDLSLEHQEYVAASVIDDHKVVDRKSVV